MGRMLETLKLGEGMRSPLAAAKTADATPVQDCVVDWEIGAEVPFVEVGGPNKRIELSPGLLKHPAQAAPQAPHLQVETQTPPPASRVVTFLEAKPMTAALEPWPGSSTSAAIGAEVVAYHQPDHPTSKEYCTLLETMRHNLNTGAANLVLLFGQKPNAGTSTVLLNLAVTAAMKQKMRVAVVDADFGHAGLARRLGQLPVAGLLEVVDGSLALEQALQKTPASSMQFLSAGLIKKSSALGCDAMKWLTSWLRERFDLIFVDGPSLEYPLDLAALVPHADGIYLVLSQGEAATLDKGVAQIVSRMGGCLCGLIHTHFEL